VTHSFRISRQANYRDTNSDNQQRIAASRPWLHALLWFHHWGGHRHFFA
jgi:hypothetical protein